VPRCQSSNSGHAAVSTRKLCKQGYAQGVGGKRLIEGDIAGHGVCDCCDGTGSKPAKCCSALLSTREPECELTDPIFLGTECDLLLALLLKGVGRDGGTLRKVPCTTTSQSRRSVPGVRAGALRETLGAVSGNSLIVPISSHSFTLKLTRRLMFFCCGVGTIASLEFPEPMLSGTYSSESGPSGQKLKWCCRNAAFRLGHEPVGGDVGVGDAKGTDGIAKPTS